MFQKRLEYLVPSCIELLSEEEWRLCQSSLDGDVEKVQFEEWD